MRSKTGAACVVAFVRQRLLDGALRAGDRLPAERDLSQLLGLSRPVLREGLQALSVLGLVDIRHGSGAFVSRPSPGVLSDALLLGLVQGDGVVEDVMQARIAIECQAIRLACRLVTDNDLAEINRSLEAFVATLDDPEQGGNADYAFHSRVVEASRSPSLIAIYGTIAPLLLRSHVERRRLAMPDPEVIGSLVQAHREVFAALVTGKPDTAEAKLREHFEISARLRRNRFLTTENSRRSVTGGRQRAQGI